MPLKERLCRPKGNTRGKSSNLIGRDLSKAFLAGPGLHLTLPRTSDSSVALSLQEHN